MTSVTAILKKSDAILRSHERCGMSYGLHAQIAPTVMRLQAGELKHRHGAFFSKLGGFAPEIETGKLLPEKTRYGLFVSDADGFIIDAFAPIGSEDEFVAVGLANGGYWNEKLAGTNGISICLRHGRAISVVGQDHFLRSFHNFACSSAPLRDAQGTLIGTLTLVGTAQNDAMQHAWCEQLLVMASERLQTRLFRSFHADLMTARIVSPPHGRNAAFETLAACDEDGRLIATLPLTLGQPVPPEHCSLLGRHLSRLEGVRVNLTGPMTPPRRRPGTPMAQSLARRPRRIAAEALARLATHGRSLAELIARGRKMLAHRVPLLICGAPDIGKSELARLLLEDQAPASSFSAVLDCAATDIDGTLDEALNQIDFLLDNPVENVVPILTLLRVNLLSAQAQRRLEVTLTRLQAADLPERDMPVLAFTADQPRDMLCASTNFDSRLLYRMAQAVLDMPPICHRDKKLVLDDVITADFPDLIEIAPAARAKLLAYDWPGNFREMHAVLREAMICGNGQRVNLPDLPHHIRSAPIEPAMVSRRQRLSEALDSTGWNVSQSARLLGIGRATINRWILEEALRRPE